MFKTRNWRWHLALLCEAALAMIASALLLLFCLMLPTKQAGVCYDVFGYGLLPLLAAALACFAVRKGLHYYLSWLVPAPCFVLTSVLMIGVLPEPGMALLAVLLGFVGAAWGEERNRRERKKGGATWRKS